MLALGLAYQQLSVRILWAGLRLEGQPPQLTPLKTPVYARQRATEAAEQDKQRQHLARVAQLRKYSPTYQQAG